ncbi:MAG: 23S rRNA (uracil(1939)-C(5))-methyltransferase RlmD [Alphaproteobacteria bacterium]|nr:23S rRNA (uracil(1939)-C(5))-methyltransferase RlmD [Alphaproteobacteria bacterium]
MGRDVVITPRAWSHRGEAELTVRGKPMRVWQGIPGEHARVRVVHEGQHADYAVFRESPSPSPRRVEPRCAKYHTCGGCPWMHLDAQGQQDARVALVRDALDAEGLDDVAIDGFVQSPDGQDDFRWVTKLGVAFSDIGRLRVGAWGRNTRSVVPIPHCHVVAEPLRRAMASVAHHVIDLAIPPYDPERDVGVLRAIVLRGARSGGGVVVTLVAGRRTRALSDLASLLVGADAGILGVALHLNDEPGNAIFAHDEEGRVRTMVLEGDTVLEEELGGITYLVGPADFFQTNPGMAEVLYRDVVDQLGLEPGLPFVDLYCGVGGLALLAARTTGWALGVEEGVGAVERAREAAKRNGLEGVEFFAGRVEEQLDAVRRRLGDAVPVVAVDPARRGLEAGVVDGISTLRPARLAYISCNPRALARDLVALRQQGMRLDTLVLYDMFPNTSHVECLAVLSTDSEPTSRRAPRRRVVGTSDRRPPE